MKHLSFKKLTDNFGLGTAKIETFEDNNIQECELRKVFGVPSNDNSMNRDKGYGAAWYFEASSGSVFGVGFRFGTLRTRGKAFGHNKQEYAQFLNWFLESTGGE